MCCRTDVSCTRVCLRNAQTTKLISNITPKWLGNHWIMLVGLGIMLGFMQINHSLTQISEISPASWPQLMASKLIGKLLRKQSAWFYVPFSTRNVDIGNQSTVGLWVSKTKKLRSPCLRGGLWPRRPRPFFFFFCENILAVGAAQADDTCVASWKLTFTYHKTATREVCYLVQVIPHYVVQAFDRQWYPFQYLRLAHGVSVSTKNGSM